jgi:hypothetical protein
MTVEYVDNKQALLKLMTDETKIIKRVDIVGGWDDPEDPEPAIGLRKVCVQYQSTEEAAVSARGTNVVDAAFITTFARLRLFEFLYALGPNNVLYCDTDSGIVLQGPGIPLVEEGFCLGDFQSELEEGVHIEEFVALGPKSYCYACSANRQGEKKTVIKVKGIHQSLNTKDVSFDSLKEILFKFFEFGPKQQDVVVPQRQFKRRLLPTATVRDEETKKAWRFTYDKRQILDAKTFMTVPHGY